MAKKFTAQKKSKATLLRLSLTREGYAQSFDGTKIWFKAQGKGPCLICFNGMGCDPTYFGYLQEYFSKNYTVITFDYRGHGQSDTPKDPLQVDLEQLARDAFAVIQALKIKKALLIGYSMGSQVAYEFYKQNPKHVAAIISLFGTYHRPLDTFYDFAYSRHCFEVFFFLNHLFPQGAKFLGKAMLKNPLWFQIGGLTKMLQPLLVDKSMIKRYLEHMCQIHPVFIARLIKSMQEHDTESIVRKLKVPFLIVGGEDDRFTPLRVANKLHQLVSQSELFIVKKGSHVGLIEQPELVHLRLEKFFHSVFKSKTKAAIKKKVKPKSLAKIKSRVRSKSKK